jgi:UDP:flavonoid glycosyltransferase YjiC (YdhE family)
MGTNEALTSLPEWPSIEAAVPHKGMQQLWAFIQGFGPQMADDLINLMPAWKPDVIVRDPLEFGSCIAAELFDIPYASILWALYISPRYGCTAPLNALRQRYGLPDDPTLDSFDRYFVLNALPPSWALTLGAPPPAVTHRFCMPPFDVSVQQDLPDWVQGLDDHPNVYATLGTTFNQHPQRFRALLEAVSTEDFNTIITVGQSVDPAQFYPLPPRVKIEQYIPQTLILPHCDAVIFHGGFNSLHSALWHGLPTVIMPLEAGDQQPTGFQCAELGLGVLVDGDQPEVIRTAITSILADATYRSQAQRLQQEMMELPSLLDAVQRLEVLARTHEPQLTNFV